MPGVSDSSIYLSEEDIGAFHKEVRRINMERLEKLYTDMAGR